MLETPDTIRDDVSAVIPMTVRLMGATSAVALLQWAFHVVGLPAVTSYIASVAAGVAVLALWRRRHGAQ